MLNGKLINSYPKNGRIMFVFLLAGTKEAKEEYLAAQKKRYPEGKFVDQDGEPLYWTASPSGKNITVNITTNGNVVEDKTDILVAASTQANYDVVYDSIKANLKRSGTGAAALNLTPTGATAGAPGPLDKD